MSILDELLEFRENRNWKQFHSPKSLACSISIEANELLELFQWSDECNDIERSKQEVADICIYLMYFCNDMNIDLLKAVKEKIAINEKKYPIEKSKGNSVKYDKL